MTISEALAFLNQQALLTTLAERPWVEHVAVCTEADAIFREMSRIGDILGTRTEGRAGAILEIIRPVMVQDAHPRSLSGQFGLAALPFHTELSHRTRPCRYLLLGCIDPGYPSTATMLLDWRTLGFSPDELNLLKSAPILVRNGRRSFYSTVLSPDHAFLRYDLGCMEAVDKRGQAAMALVEHHLAQSSSQAHNWRRGDILIIDNWRVLHGRNPSYHGSRRRLARILIDA